ncbi:MAG: hypothetical protein KDC67_15105 [Ignavibacteriae bacterium]|nr:hypothetical protein [Ignavibacteriota bacterium]
MNKEMSQNNISEYLQKTCQVISHYANFYDVDFSSSTAGSIVINFGILTETNHIPFSKIKILSMTRNDNERYFSVEYYFVKSSVCLIETVNYTPENMELFK